MKRFFSLFLVIATVLSFNCSTSFAAESNSNTTNYAKIIGEYDAPLSQCYRGKLSSSVSNVRVRSYAKYDEDDGITVTVKLYVPWYESPKPKFTGMAGKVDVVLNNDTTSTTFYETADGDSTISSDVDTGVTGNSGDSGTISVAGLATSENALGGGGAFAISYPITIP